MGSKTRNIEIIGLCESSEETTAEVIPVYDAIIHCFEGNEIIYTEGRHKFCLSKGESLFVPKGLLITATGIPTDGVHRGAVISFLPELIREYNHRLCKSSAKLILSNNTSKKITNPDVLSFIKSFEPLLEIESTLASSLIKPKMLELLLLLEITNCIAFLRSDSIVSRKEKITFLSDLNISESITIDEMANRLGLSLATFKREFKKTFKESAKQWLIKKRIEKAYHLLMTSSKSIKEISSECGFSDSSHFIRLFKRTYGFSPGALSKQSLKIYYP